MSKRLVTAFSFIALDSAVMAAVIGMNTSSLRKCTGTGAKIHGKGKCPCVGIDNLKGYYATQQDFYHVQYPAEAGASCAAWDSGMHPKCREGVAPEWCKQKWCYVDPCNCDLDELPRMSKAGIEYQGSPAYWSYGTCGDTDFFSQEMSPDACIMQKSEGACAANPDCAWDGKQCGGKEAVKSCKVTAAKDETVYGEEDCRCVGMGGRGPGKTFMFINDKDLAEYPVNVGATCAAWEMDVHPDCLKDGEKPSWCAAKWCFVDPCKCKTKVAPKAVMKANEAMRFQGKTAYWSYAACGSTDSWSAAHKGEYCGELTSEASCTKLSKCAWDGKECLGKALVELCAKQQETGVLGVEAALPSATFRAGPVLAALVLLGILTGA